MKRLGIMSVRVRFRAGNEAIVTIDVYEDIPFEECLLKRSKDIIGYYTADEYTSIER